MKLAELFERIVGPDAPIAFRAYDGSTAGPSDAAATLTINSPKALWYLVTAPGELGVSRAYVSGALDIDGDIHEAMRLVDTPVELSFSWREKLELLRLIGPALVRIPRRPPEEIRLRGRRHSRRRDAAAISHHYDVSNRFYRMWLGPSMAYTCAVFQKPDASLEEAQAEKHDLVCRKLALEPGMRLLDVGCGWGGMVLHAAEHYGVTALGVTLSRNQAEWAQKEIAEAGLSDRALVRHQDYRDVPEGHFDAISAIGLTEHIGEGQMAGYFTHLFDKLRPQGRLLNHAIKHPNRLDGARMDRRGFIDRYVFPDGELTDVGSEITIMADIGFEVRHEENLREHYTKTLRCWVDNLEANWDAAVDEVGAGRARVWRLYMAGSEASFAANRVQLHQVLATKTEHGDSGMLLRPDW